MNEDTTLYRTITVNPLDKYIYKLVGTHIICFPALTSTSVQGNRFYPTQKASKVNNINNDRIRIEMIIKYKHQEGNITPALKTDEFSNVKDFL